MNRLKKTLRKPKTFIIVLLTVAVIAPAAKIGDDFFEISKNLEIFSELYKNINIYYADETKPGALMKTGDRCDAQVAGPIHELHSGV